MPKSAIETFKQAIDAYENSLKRSNVGAIEAQLGKPLTDPLEDAKRESYLAIVKMCGYLNSWNGAADTAFLERVQGGLDNIQKRIEENANLAPFAYLVAYARGFVFRGQGQHKKAFEAFEKSANLNEKFFRADAQKAAQQIYLDNLPEAGRLIEIAIGKTPPTSPAFANEKWTAGRIEFFLGHYEVAIKLLGESIKLNDDLWYAIAYQCSAYSYIGQTKDAERLLMVLKDKFKINSVQDVIDREKLNPSAGAKSVDEGRQRLHDGLVKAGLSPLPRIPDVEAPH
jgi:tetratricopeptide (TPR) repeat protein